MRTLIFRSTINVNNYSLQAFIRSYVEIPVSNVLFENNYIHVIIIPYFKRAIT